MNSIKNDSVIEVSVSKTPKEMISQASKVVESYVRSFLMKQKKVYRHSMSLHVPSIGQVEIKLNKWPFTPSREMPIKVTFGRLDADQNIKLPMESREIFHFFSKLPLTDWDKYWDKIFLPKQIKEKLMNYVMLVYNFIDRPEPKLSPISDQISFALYRTILLYGPSGTGKTSIARGLLNKATKMLIQRKRCDAYVAEINTHKLSSRWLGGSPQMVQKAFAYIKDISRQADVVFVLVDEVESLLTNRELTLTEANPVDVFRAVNAVLEEIDLLVREHSNVFLITTSNLTEGLDEAFMDRVDLRIKIDLPNEESRKLILSDTLSEYERVFATTVNLNETDLNELCKLTKGLSARDIRRLPLDTVTSSSKLAGDPKGLTLNDIIDAMKRGRIISNKDPDVLSGVSS